MDYLRYYHKDYYNKILKDKEIIKLLDKINYGY